MKCAIMQPTYVPWVGYFSMINQVDTFVFLDDVQFARRSWQQRNRILLQGKETFLTIPVLTKGKRELTINEIATDESQKWREDHLKKIFHAYSKHKFGHCVIKLMKEELDVITSSLSDTNIRIIERINKELGIKTKTIRSSSLFAKSKKSQYLIDICNELGATTYLSAPGSKQYIEEEQLFSTQSLELTYHNFEPFPYKQFMVNEFVPHMSILDLLANVGFQKASEYIEGKS